MSKLEEIFQVEEKKLDFVELYFQEDVVMFDEFFKENDYGLNEVV